MYVTFDTYPNVPGRQYRNAATDPVTGKISCEVDTALGGEVTTTPEEHARIVAAANQYVIDHPPVQPAPPAPSPLKQIVTALQADPALALSTKAVLSSIAGAAALGNVTVPMTPLVG